MPNYLTSISDYSTRELTEELIKRVGVEEYTVAPHKEATITIEEDWNGESEAMHMEGSARIIVVTD